MMGGGDVFFGDMIYWELSHIPSQKRYFYCKPMIFLFPRWDMFPRSLEGTVFFPIDAAAHRSRIIFGLPNHFTHEGLVHHIKLSTCAAHLMSI